jgi:hypothetical protein
MIRNVEMERFTVTSAKPFDEVVACIKEAIGHPNMAEFWQSTQRATSASGLDDVIRPVLGKTGPAGNDSAQGVIVWSSFFFTVLQSICTFFAAVDGLRLMIGVGSLAVSAGIGTAMDRFHQDWIRVPMMVLALLGSSLNLMILMQIRHLRNRPASRWRQRPLSPSRIRMERVQMALSLTTLVLIGVEEYLHLRWCGHL